MWEKEKNDLIKLLLLFLFIKLCVFCSVWSHAVRNDHRYACIAFIVRVQTIYISTYNTYTHAYLGR